MAEELDPEVAAAARADARRLEPAPKSGLIYLSTPRATFGLIVKDDIVVDAPPYARFAIGQHAGVLWENFSRRPENTLRWIED